MPPSQRRRFLMAVLAAFLLLACPGVRLSAQGPQQFRNVSGKVVDAHHHPVKGAIVKLENESSQSIMSYVTDADGYFHFKRVSTTDDFKLWASINGAYSRKHGLSKFNSKEAPFITLQLP